MAYDFIKYIVKFTAPQTQRYLEIGSFAGRSLEVACKANPNMKVVSIDPNLRSEMKNILRRYPQIQHIRKKSQRVNWDEVEKFDSIYIDGHHGFSAVRADLANCWKAWTRKGVFFGDDHDPKHGVFQAVNEFFGIDIKEVFRTRRQRIDLDELENSNLHILKQPLPCRGGFLQKFGPKWVYFTPELYEHYPEIYAKSRKFLTG